MAVKAHVRQFVAGLEQAPPWDPRGLASALELALQDRAGALRDWVDTVHGLRVGHGAVHMHRRHAASAPVGVRGLEDFEALLLCAACLRLGLLVQDGYSPASAALAHATTHAGDWLVRLLRMEPDFLDELLLEVAARHASHPDLARSIRAQAELLDQAATDLHRQAHALLGGRRTARDLLRSMVGAGPDLARGEWARWCRAVVVLGLLDAKG